MLVSYISLWYMTPFWYILVLVSSPVAVGWSSQEPVYKRTLGQARCRDPPRNYISFCSRHFVVRPKCAIYIYIHIYTYIYIYVSWLIACCRPHESIYLHTVLWIQTLPEKVLHPPKSTPVTLPFRRYGWIPSAGVSLVCDDQPGCDGSQCWSTPWRLRGGRTLGGCQAVKWSEHQLVAIKTCSSNDNNDSNE